MNNAAELLVDVLGSFATRHITHEEVPSSDDGTYLRLFSRTREKSVIVGCLDGATRYVLNGEGVRSPYDVRDRVAQLLWEHPAVDIRLTVSSPTFLSMAMDRLGTVIGANAVSHMDGEAYAVARALCEQSHRWAGGLDVILVSTRTRRHISDASNLITVNPTTVKEMASGAFLGLKPYAVVIDDLNEVEKKGLTEARLREMASKSGLRVLFFRTRQFLSLEVSNGNLFFSE